MIGRQGSDSTPGLRQRPVRGGTELVEPLIRHGPPDVGMDQTREKSELLSDPVVQIDRDSLPFGDLGRSRFSYQYE